MTPPKPCTCPLVGYCDRHEVAKGIVWHQLCQTRDNYRAAWDEGRGPGQPKQAMTEKQQELNAIAKRVKDEREADRLIQSRECWRQLHGYPAAHAENWNAAEAEIWLAGWEETIPKFGCGGTCRKRWIAIKEKLRPVFATPDEFHRWTIDAHNVVNRDLGKPIFRDRP